MSTFEVGDRMELRGGIVVECIEVYDDHGIRTGKWVEVEQAPNSSSGGG